MALTLPVHAVLPDLAAVLRRRASAVLVAPPGAGKTTAVAPALLAEPWCTGQILLLSPRRLAARAAAERMAELAGERVGGTIGYATRMDRKVSSATRILVVTEGIFVSRIQADPELAGVSAVLFDEVHERSLDSDFGLALALDAQSGLRPDLRLVAMSATLDGARFAALMDDAPVIESAGRAWPLTLRHAGRDPAERIEDAVASAVLRALAEEQDGGVLAFLPGVGEIARTAERLAPRLPPGIALHQLHGSLDPAEQRRAIAPAPGRKVVLATSIAETSLTLDGIRIVVDSGLARRPRHDSAAGVTRLVTTRASQAAVTQRAGRAARQGPGTAWRLWEEAATAGLPAFDTPEILEADLMPVALDCAIWGADPATLRWLDPPPRAALAQATRRLTALGALDADGRPTAQGRAMAALPLPPRLAHMLLVATGEGYGAIAAHIAVLLGERGLGGPGTDLDTRLARWRRDRGPRATAARQLADRLARLAGAGRDAAEPPADVVARCVAIAWPDRIARRRDTSGEHWQSTGGRGFRLDPADPLATAEWLAVGDVQGAAGGARITAAARLEIVDYVNYFAALPITVRFAVTHAATFDPATGQVSVRRSRKLGAITLADAPDPAPDRALIAAALLDGIRDHGLDLLPWSDESRRLRHRAQFAAAHGGPAMALDDATLLATLDDWLAPLVAGCSRLDAIDAQALHHALAGLAGWSAIQALDRFAPDHFVSPAGTRHPIDYAAPGGPLVTLRVQALFGLNSHPGVAGGQVPLILSLTSPAGRPVQTTRDLPGFWAGSWRDVAKEMRGRYPRHNWPDDPRATPASLKTKRAQARERS